MPTLWRLQMLELDGTFLGVVSLDYKLNGIQLLLQQITPNSAVSYVVGALCSSLWVRDTM
jgi:hypothetical protein